MANGFWHTEHGYVNDAWGHFEISYGRLPRLDLLGMVNAGRSNGDLFCGGQEAQVRCDLLLAWQLNRNYIAPNFWRTTWLLTIRRVSLGFALDYEV